MIVYLRDFKKETDGVISLLFCSLYQDNTIVAALNTNMTLNYPVILLLISPFPLNMRNNYSLMIQENHP